MKQGYSVFCVLCFVFGKMLSRLTPACTFFLFGGLAISPTRIAAAQQPDHQTPNTKHQTPNTKSPVFTGADVMAKVEGRIITRRELTYFWLSIDRQAGVMLGDLLSDRWRAAKGSLPAYTVSEAAIYARLYSAKPAVGDKTPPYANVLATMVTNRLVEIEAARRHVVVTRQEAQAAAHQMFDQMRKQQNLDISDDQIMTQFHVPRDIFMEDMMFRLRVERLLAADLARRNGHPLTAEDRANWPQTVAKEKPEYLTRLLHSAHITSAIPLPAPTPTAPAQRGGAEMPPPPPGNLQ